MKLSLYYKIKKLIFHKKVPLGTYPDHNAFTTKWKESLSNVCLMMFILHNIQLQFQKNHDAV